jgi:hypothetical protein
MTTRSSLGAFPLLIAALAIYVWHTSQGLPPIVATHFDLSGAANGHMSRSAYAIALPLAAATSSTSPIEISDCQTSTVRRPSRSCGCIFG